MNILRLGRNVTIIALILSLLFHVSTIVYIFIQKKTNPFITSEEQQQQELERIQKKETEEWAETKARASNFGAPVFFEDSPDDPHSENEEEQSPEQINTAGPPEITEPDELPAENNPTEESVIEPTAVASPDFHNFNEVALQKITQPEPAQPIKKAPRKKRTRTKKATPQQNNYTQARSAPKPPLSLAQLTQGFMHHLKDEGKYAVSMLGNKSGRPTEEQLKYERYLQKLGWCLQNAYNINSDRCPAIPQDTTMHVNLILNRDGTTRHLAVSKSSQNLHLDAFTLFIFREASSSFPPVPDYLKVDPFAITYVITVGASDGKNMRFYQR
jgi:hypothetical protein